MKRFPKEISNAYKLWGKFKAESKDFVGEIVREWHLEEVDQKFNRSGWARKLDIEVVKTADLDRCGDVLSGPLFVSNSYPWPSTADGHSMLPCMQINLTRCSKLMKTNYGEGLLQLWAHPEAWKEFSLRVITLDQVSKKNLLKEIPLKKDELPEVSLVPTDWLTDDKSYAIKGFGPLYFTIQELFIGEPFVDSFLAQNIPANHKDGQKKIKNLMRLESAFIQAAESAEKFSPGGHHLGGTFYPIQYFASEKPDMLFSIDSVNPYLWGSSGNAQVFYTPLEDGKFKYDFAWSC